MLRNVYFGQVQYLFPGVAETFKLNNYNGQVETLDQTFKGKVITDFSVNYQFSPQFSLTIGANNALNIFPDQQTHSENVSYSRFLYSRRVQQFGTNGAFWFGRLIFNLR